MEEKKKLPERTPDDESEEVIGITEEDSSDFIEDMLEKMPEIKQIVRDLLEQPNELENNVVTALRGLLEPSPSSEQMRDGWDALFDYLQEQIVDWINLPDWETSRLHMHAHPILLTDPIAFVLYVLLNESLDEPTVAALYREHQELQLYAQEFGIDAAYEHFLKTHRGVRAINAELGSLHEELKKLNSLDADLPRQVELCQRIIDLDGMIHTLSDLTRGIVFETLGYLLLRLSEQQGGAEARELIEQAISHYDVALKIFDRNSMASHHARAQQNKADALRSLSEWQEGVEASRSLEQAIACSDIFLGIYDLHSMPQAHATIQQRKGVSLALLAALLAGIEALGLLEQAIVCFDIALEIFDRHNMPQSHAMTQVSKGGALLRLAEGLGGAKSVKSLEQAITCFDIALEIYERDNLPLDYASAQMNKGGALLRLAERHGRTNAIRLLEQAIACFDAGLEINGSSSLTSKHAGIQLNKGTALHNLAEQYSGEERMRLLEQAIACFDIASEIEGHNSKPQERAITQMSKGTALYSLAEERTGTEAVELLEQAIACFDMALTIFDRSMPQWHAKVQMNKGNALQSLAAERSEKVELLEQAIACFDNALEMHGRDSRAPDYAAAQKNKGNALWRLAKLRKGAEAVVALEQAIACFDIALTIFDSGSMPSQHVNVQLSKGYVLQSLAEQRGGAEMVELFEQAITCFDAVLSVCDRTSMPSEYARAQMCKVTALEKLAEQYLGAEAMKPLTVRDHTSMPPKYLRAKMSKGTAVEKLTELAAEEGMMKFLEQASVCLYDVIEMNIDDFVADIPKDAHIQMSEDATRAKQVEESKKREVTILPEPSQHYPTLQLTQTSKGTHNYDFDVEFNGQKASIGSFYELSEQYLEDTRWYLEDYLHYPFDPAPAIASNIEERMAEIGRNLFKTIFQSSKEARELWSALRPQLSNIRFEISTELGEATDLPWELLREPQTDTLLALQARAFVRTQSNTAKSLALPQPKSRPIRILLVISRPGGSEDVPFRSIANHLLKSLIGRDDFQLEVLRPSTFAQLTTYLRAARTNGRPYHIVHFDGHGIYEDVLARSSGKPPKKLRGYLEFENPEYQGNVELVHGTLLGKELSNAGVSLLVMNACRSAHTKALAEPQKSATNDQTRSYGALAHEVIDAGVPGVVAMRYNIHVSTAAQFIADLYTGLMQGLSLGEAGTLARKNLHAQPFREVNGIPCKLEDWSVPLVFEAAPITLFPKSNKDETQKPNATIELTAITLTRQMLEANLPPSPGTGFIGRDETIQAIDRAFNSRSIVLLHGAPGCGKTATAAEFARWYALTGGLNGPVLFTSIEQHKSFAQVLDKVSQVFAKELEQLGIQWATLSEERQLMITLYMLRKKAVLWILDNVDVVDALPPNESIAWSPTDLEHLRVLLALARLSKAKFLLTTRQDELAFASIPMARIEVPPMPMQERVQLTQALAEKQEQLSSILDWRALLEYSQGNPQAITVLVNQALRLGLQTKEQFQDFVARLRADELTLQDDIGEERSKSLSISPSYPFRQAFNEDESRQLALLHLFQDFVNVVTLLFMGDPSVGRLPEIRHLEYKNWIMLLDRAIDLGMLTLHGKGCYLIHPASRSYLKSLFDLYYPADDLKGNELVIQVTRAFVEAMGEMGDHYLFDYMNGDLSIADTLNLEVPNLLHAWKLARSNKWWDALTSIMQGLTVLNHNTDRWAEWVRLVEEITPDFVDLSTGGPVPNCEEWWYLVTGYRVEIAGKTRQWEVAEQVQSTRVAWNRHRASSVYALPLEALTAEQHNILRSLAVSLTKLGTIFFEQKKLDCVEFYREAMALCQRLDERKGEAVCALNLAHYYFHNRVTPSNLELAEHWYRQCLHLWGEKDRSIRGGLLYHLGQIAFARFEEAQKIKYPKKGDLLRYIRDAVHYYRRALAVLPSNDWKNLSMVYKSLGGVYFMVGAADPTEAYMREAIRYAEMAGDQHGAAQYREMISFQLALASRPIEANLYMEEAQRLYKAVSNHELSDTLEVKDRIKPES